MFFNDIIQRRLMSLLQPWLRGEPELEVKLGFFRSSVLAKNLLLDSSFLNQLIDEPNAISIKEVTVDHLVIWFSNWSVPALTVEVGGVHVTLSVGDFKEKKYPIQQSKSRVTFSEKLKKNLAAIDPEGTTLHGILERILDTPPSRGRFRKALMDLILKNCHLKMHNINLKLESPIFNHICACQLGVKELNSVSRDLDRQWLPRGFICALFQPQKFSTFVINSSDLEFVLKRDDQISRILYVTDLYTCIKLNNLRLADLSIKIPKVNFSISPAELSICTALVQVSSMKSNHGRDGRQLWKLAASRITSATSAHRLSIHQLVSTVQLWIRYIKSYECVLLLTGYSAAQMVNKFTTMMSRDKKLLNSLKEHWKVITAIEKELSFEAIAQARRISRYRAALDIKRAENHKESVDNIYFKCFNGIISLLLLIWKLIYTLFYFLSFVVPRGIFAQEQKEDQHSEIVRDDVHPKVRFILNLGKVSVTVFHVNEIQSVNNGKLLSNFGISYSDLQSFCLSIDALLIMYVEDICEQSFLLSCGQVNIKSSSSMEALRKNNSNDFRGSVEEHLTERADDVNSILWGEAVQCFLPSESSDYLGYASNPVLSKFLEDMWLNWKSACIKFEESELEYSINPCFLCEIISSLTYGGLEEPNTGLLKCSLMLGKLNLSLGCTSILSLSLLLRQIQHASSWTEGAGRRKDHLQTPITIMKKKIGSHDCENESYTSQLTMTLLEKLPERHIEVGMLIAGPHVLLSLKNEFNGGNETPSHMDHCNDLNLVLDIHDIEFAGWPTSIRSWQCGDVESEGLRLKEPQITNISKSHKDKYVSQQMISLRFYLRISGLNAYLEESARKQQNKIVVLNSMVIQGSSIRKYVCTFSSNIAAFSASLCGVAAGLTGFSYVDELYVFFQVIGRLFSAASCVHGTFDSASWAPLEFMRQEMAFIEPVHEDARLKEVPLICTTSQLFFNGTFKFGSMDVVVHNSRVSDNLTELNSPDCGIWTSFQQANVNISCEDEKLEVFANITEIQSVVFRYQKRSTECSVSKDLLMQSFNCYYAISLSSCMLTLWVALPHNVSSSGGCSYIVSSSTSGDNTSNMVESNVMVDPKQSSSKSTIQKLCFDSPPSSTTPRIFISVALDQIFITKSSTYNILVGAHESNKLLSSISIGGDIQNVSWKIQGGFLFLEMAALAVFCRCFELYIHRIGSLSSVLQSLDEDDEKAGDNVDVARLNDGNITGCVQETSTISQQDNEKQLEAFVVDMSNFSLVLVFEDESGGIREFVIDVVAHLNFQLAHTEKKFVFNLSRLSILSQVVDGSSEYDIQIPHFSSGFSSRGDSASRYQRSESVNDASCSRDHVFREDSSVNNCGSEVFQLNNQKYILKSLVALMSMEKRMHGLQGTDLVWAGNSSISGFDMTLSLSEIKMILLMASSFSRTFGKETTGRLNERQWAQNHEIISTMEAMIPNGAIVAIQDVQQHMYFAVEGEENKFNLVGTVHYSLVGERALFRVKYNNQRRWPSPVLWFSLISLCAKSGSGEPLRLNCRPGSGFVDISGTNDRGTALWKTLSCETESHEGDIDWEPYNQLTRKTFYLVNKRNDCGVAFLDGVPEFVSKPGNPFKLKVFHGHPAGPAEASGTSRQHKAWMGERFPCIDISLDNISLTIVHEVLETKDILPLLCGCINNIQLKMQIHLFKIRVMSECSAVLYSFDNQGNTRRELLHPTEFLIFYRSNITTNRTETTSYAVPVHIYCRVKKFDISLSENSLDILLFVIGKLNLAGPYSVRSSTILGNCCKVENRTGLDLLCQFYERQSVTIARQQSASIFLRHSDLSDKRPESTAVISFQLAVPGSFTTSPIHLSQLHAQAFAWRTRIISLQDSRTYPGPFVVVDVSRKSGDGLSIVVSPVIRIHNDSRFLLELRFRRPQKKEDEYAVTLLKPGDIIDDSMASFDALNISGESKKTLVSLSVGNFFFSFRPDVTDFSINSENSVSVEWSDEFKGEKAVCLSGIFDKLSYKVRKALFVGSEKCSFSTAHCNLQSGSTCVSGLHFLIQSIGREVPVRRPDKFIQGYEKKGTSPVALQDQREIFLLPTVLVANLLYSEIHVSLSETDTCTITGCDNVGNQATISSGSVAHFYANPSIIYFTVTIPALSSTCKPVNSSDCVKKLLKQKSDVHYLDIDLDFSGGKYIASLRLSRGHRGILEATIFTSYVLKNNTKVSLSFWSYGKKTQHRQEAGKFDPFPSIPPDLGLTLPPNSMRSWFIKSKKVVVKMTEDYASEALLDLDALTGFTEISLETEEISGVKSILKLGVSMGPPSEKVIVPSQIVTMVPRYVVLNESEENIIIRQCYLQDDMTGMIQINSKQKAALWLQDGVSKRREFSFFENFVRKHRKILDDSLKFIQFRIDESDLSWSGPVCVASLGRFFLKFRKRDQGTELDKNITQFALIHVVEEGSTLVLHFHKPPNVNLPYRIENCLRDVPITYYQKDFLEPEVLGSQCSVDYVWDDLTLPHKLVVRINDSLLLREINLDKLRAWKPFYKTSQHRSLASQFHLEKSSSGLRTTFGEFNPREMVKVGYEVYADGPTRVLRICDNDGGHKGNKVNQLSEKIQLRVTEFTVHLLECGKQDGEVSEPSAYTPIVAARLGNINLDSVFTHQQRYNQLTIESLSLEEKWLGAPFAAMLRRHQLEYNDSKDRALQIFCVLLSTNSEVKLVKYLSIVLQPVDLNLDEETLMRIVPFWRTSLSDSNAKSQRYYFDHFEVHPVKIIANFLPGESYSSYSSTQETLRTLLHSVVKVPTVNNMVVELNGVLVTHALITIRELFIRCAQHYSWYAMRAIYIAKGSSLLPPEFVSIFDDLASSSLDVFFDPTRGLMNLPGLTLGTFKFLSKCIDGKGFSGTKRYFGDLGKTLRTAGTNVLFAAVTEISDSVLKGAEASGFNGMVNGFHQGILKIAMEPSVLGSALLEGGPDRKIKLDRTPGIDELYIEGYLQAMLDTMYRQEYLRVRVIDDQVILKNLPPNSSLIDEIMERVKGFLMSRALLKGDPSATTHPLRHLRGESQWQIGPTVMTLCEHLFVSFAIRMLRKQANNFIGKMTLKKSESDDQNTELALIPSGSGEDQKQKFIWKWGLGKFLLSGILAYVDGRLCRCIPNPLARRIVSGFLLTFLDNNNNE